MEPNKQLQTSRTTKYDMLPHTVKWWNIWNILNQTRSFKMLSSTSLYFWNPKACIFDNTYKVVHGEWNIIQDLNQKLLSNQGSDVSVPVGQPLTAEDGRMQKRKRKRTVHAYKVFGPRDMLWIYRRRDNTCDRHIVKTAVNSAFIRARDVKKLDATPVLCPYWSSI